MLLLTLLHTMNNTTLAETPRLPVLKRCALHRTQVSRACEI